MAVSSSMVTPVGFGFVSAFLIKGDKPMLVDTGIPGGSEKIIKSLSSSDIDPKDISLILLTHCHYDHCGSTAELKKLTGAKVAIHRLCADSLKYGASEEIIAYDLKGKIIRLVLPEKPFEGSIPDLLIDDELDLADFGVKGRAIHTPGHTPGSISVILDSGEAIVGDLASGAPIKWPVFATDLQRVKESLKRVMSFKPTKIYVSHGGSLEPETVRNMLK